MSLSLAAFAASLWFAGQADVCLARIPCPVGASCGCRIQPVAEYARFFYFDIGGVRGGKRYTCHFGSSSSRLRFTPDLSVFPGGATYRCSGSCPNLPMSLKLAVNRADHGGPDEVVLVKVHMPAGGAPEDVQVACSEDL